MSRRTVIIIAVLFALLFIVIVIFAIINSTRDRSQAYLEDAVSITVDKDTGQQTVIEDPNLVDEGYENPGVTIFGLDLLLEEGLLPTFTDFVKEQVNIYVQDRHSNQYETVTFRPQDFKKQSKTVYVSTLRLGQTDELVPITITANGSTGRIKVVIEDPDNKYGGTFDSGVTTFSGE